MNTVHLKRNPNGLYNVIELGEFDTVCSNCLRLLLEDHNDIYEQGELAVNAINKAIRTFNKIADLVEAEPKFNRSEVVLLLKQLRQDLTAPPHMSVPDLKDALTSLFTTLLGPLKEDVNAQAAEESHTENL